MIEQTACTNVIPDANGMNDCRYILQICAQVVGAILHLLQQNSMPLGCYM